MLLTGSYTVRWFCRNVEGRVDSQNEAKHDVLSVERLEGLLQDSKVELNPDWHGIEMEERYCSKITYDDKSILIIADKRKKGLFSKYSAWTVVEGGMTSSLDIVAKKGVFQLLKNLYNQQSWKEKNQWEFTLEELGGLLSEGEIKKNPDYGGVLSDSKWDAYCTTVKIQENRRLFVIASKYLRFDFRFLQRGYYNAEGRILDDDRNVVEMEAGIPSKKEVFRLMERLYERQRKWQTKL